MKISCTNTKGEFSFPADIKDGILCHDSLQYCKEPHPRCDRNFWLHNSYHPPLVTLQI